MGRSSKIRIAVILTMAFLIQSVVPVSGTELSSYDCGEIDISDMNDEDKDTIWDDEDAETLLDGMIEEEQSSITESVFEDETLDAEDEELCEVNEFLEEESVELSGDYMEPEADASMEEVTDKDGNSYSYDPDNWYKGNSQYQHFQSHPNGYFYTEMDVSNRRLILRRVYKDDLENIYIPAKTMINGVEYTTELHFGNSSTGWGPALHGEFAYKARHVFIQAGVEVPDSDTSTFGMFEGCPYLESVDMTDVDFKDVTSLKSCFYDCGSLKKVWFGKNINKVTDVSHMFYGCSSLEEIDLSGLKDSPIEDMYQMFSSCKKLTSYVFPDIDTSSCTNIEYMFSGCSKLRVLDMRKFRTNSLVKMGSMLLGDTALQTLHLPEGLETISCNANNVLSRLPKTMYHNGEAYNCITTEMSGWILTSENIRIAKPIMDENSTLWDCIWFGHYFQDEDEPYMDKDPIMWRILSINDVGEALLLADSNLYNKQYHHTKFDVDWEHPDWEHSDIRKWLNAYPDVGRKGLTTNGFLRNAFSFEEQAAITSSNIDGVQDKVFLLSYADVTNEEYGFSDNSTGDYHNEPDPDINGVYFVNYDDGRRIAKNSKYCDQGNGYHMWFLREGNYVVGNTGAIVYDTNPNSTDRYKIRPAIRLNLYDHIDLWTYAGVVVNENEGEGYYLEGDEKPKSIKYMSDRWGFNNSRNVSGELRPEYAGFAGDSTYYINERDYNYFIDGLWDIGGWIPYAQENDKWMFMVSFLGISANTYKEYLSSKGCLKDYNKVKELLANQGGSCYGMALTKGLYSSGRYKPLGGFYKTLGEVGSIATPREHPVKSEIHLYLFGQSKKKARYSLKEVVFRKKYNDYEIEFEDLIKKAEAIKNPDNYFLLKYELPELGGSHSVLCMGGEQFDIDDGKNKYGYRIKIYDPNCSIYDDDYSYLYLNKDTAFIPYADVYFSRDSKDKLYIRDESLTELADGLNKYKDINYDTEGIRSVQSDYLAECTRHFIWSKMKEITIKDEDTDSSAVFKNGVRDDINSNLNVCYHGIDAFGEGNDNEFRGGYYTLDSIDTLGTYSVKGGMEESLDADFEYEEHIVSVRSDAKGGSAVFSNNGEVRISGLNSNDFAIERVYNEDYHGRPGNATDFCVTANGTGDITFKRNDQGGYELDDNDIGKEIKDISIFIGTTLGGEIYDIPDSKGKITVSFVNDEVIVHEDINGDGILDHEDRFSDYIPVKEITLTPSECSLAVGETKSLSVEISPSNATDKDLLWISDDPGVASVSDGKIVGVSKGTTLIKTTTGLGGELRVVGTCTVTVTDGGDDPDIPSNALEGIWIQGLKSSYPYTGSAIKPEFKVYRGKTRLYLNTDYTVQYKYNTKPGTATIIIKMKGNYSGSKSVTFKIDPATLGTDVTADTVYITYKRNKTQKPKPVLYAGDIKLKYGKNDLSFTYPSVAVGTGKAYVDGGTYKIHVAATNTNLFKGEMDVDLVIAEKPLMSAVSIKASKTGVPYDNGKAVSPVFTLKYKNKVLEEGKDYTVSYADDHTDIGKHKVTFVGNDKDYFGKKSYTFSITGKYDLSSTKASVVLDSSDLNADGSAPFTYGGAKPGAVVKYNGVKLTAGKDYTISYRDHKALGTATATIKGKGSYKGSVQRIYTIKARDINTISLNIADKPYSTRKDNYKKTSIVFVDKNYKNQNLKLNKDYTVKIDGDYGGVPKAGTEIKVVIQGIGNYTGTINTSYRIIEKNYDFTKVRVVVNSGKAYDYTGGEIKPLKSDLKVTLNNASLGADNYEIMGYFNNIKKGNSAYIKLRGKGKYAGVKIVKFKIGAAPIERLWSDVVVYMRNGFAW